MSTTAEGRSPCQVPCASYGTPQGTIRRILATAGLGPVPQPAIGDAEGNGLVVTLAELVQQVRAEGGAAAGAGMVRGPVRLVQDGDDVAGPASQATPAELGDSPASPHYLLAGLLDAFPPGEKVAGRQDGQASIPPARSADAENQSRSASASASLTAGAALKTATLDASHKIL
jgi:hypothetical protein